MTKGTMSRVAPGFAMPRMGEAALNYEAGLYAFLSNAGYRRVGGGQGTGIITVEDNHHRTFKIELTQVGGPE